MYEAEKKGNIGGLILLFAVLTAVGFLLSYVYIGLNDVVPYIYLNGLFALFFGVGLSLIIRGMKKACKITSKIPVFIVVLVCLLIVNYLRWNMFFGMWYARYLLDWDINPFLNMRDFFETFSWTLTLNPINIVGDFISDLRFFNYWGTWGLSESGNITGIPLAFIWICELLVINVLPIVTALSAVGFFLHEKNAWATPVFNDYSFRPISKDALERIEIGTEDLLDVLAAAQIKQGDAHTGDYHVLAVLNYGEEKTDYAALYNVNPAQEDGKTNWAQTIRNVTGGENPRFIKEFKLGPERMAGLEAELERKLGPLEIVPIEAFTEEDEDEGEEDDDFDGDEDDL
ncbi:MAG: hypothetical protein FWD90_00785 [Defluviitaleaceae bacterium]|nr:hypothetical protein [Defluviitaleaceae bacterium]